MPAFGPIKHRDLVKAVRKVGYEGPFSGGKHLYMIKVDIVLTIPNPHGSDIG